MKNHLKKYGLLFLITIFIVFLLPSCPKISDDPGNKTDTENPVEDPEDDPPDEEDPDGEDPDDDHPDEKTALSGRVLILHVYGTGDKTDGGISHSFIELYNKSGENADLSGHLLQYSEGGTNWKTLNLNGKNIPAGHSFLILGKKMNEKNESEGTGLLQIDPAPADMLWTDLQMSHKGFKIFLVKSDTAVTARNPFDSLGDRTGKKSYGYIDLSGFNDNDETNNIDAFETGNLGDTGIRGPFYVSKGKSARRIDLNDTDDNHLDFESLEWRSSNNKCVSADEFEALRPRTVSYGYWNPVYQRGNTENSDASIKTLSIAGQIADPGTPAPANMEITSHGSVSISGLVADNAAIEITAAEGAVFRTAKASGGGEPQWNNGLTPLYSFSDGDYLFVEITAKDNRTVNVYKIAVTVINISTAITVNGTYTLKLNSVIPQASVAIEAHLSAAGNELAARAMAEMAAGTWSMQIPPGREVWFRVEVTDNTGYTFGKIVSENGQIFGGSTAGLSLTLGPYTQPELKTFTLLNATASSGLKGNKTAVINQATGALTFENTSFTTISTATVLNFHKLAANFELSPNSKLYAENTEQISGTTVNNYYKNITFTVMAEDNARKTYTIAGQVLDPDSSASGANNAAAVNRVVGTSSWQTQGFGIMIVETSDKYTGLPVGTINKLNIIWNPTGTYTYISPTGREITGKTDIRGRGNYSLRHDSSKSYNLKLENAASFDYYDYKTKQYVQLPSHRRWGLIAHQADSTRIRTTLGWEMGRHVLTNMGWQPHGDWVFFFLNGQFKGMYILAEINKPEEGRQNITPLISSANPKGGFQVEMNNFYFYYDEGSNYYTFDELYNFMSSHQNSVNNRLQGVVWSFKEPDSNLGWYYTDPPDGNGNLSFTNPADSGYFPRKGIVLMATLGEGTAYNRKSKPAGDWIVPEEVGTPNGMGSPGMLLTGSIGQNNGGVNGTRKLSDVYSGYTSSTFVRAAQFLQDAEDAIYSHDWVEKGYGMGSYLNYLDIDAFIDWQIAREMVSDWELALLNGQHAYFDSKTEKFKMGPIWDLDQAWQGAGASRGATPGFVRKTSFWYKELLGWKVTGHNGVNVPPGEETGLKDPYYVNQLKNRWNEVSGRFNYELDAYIDAQDRRFSRITGFTNSNNANGVQSYSVSGSFGISGNRQNLKYVIGDMVNRLGPVFNGY